MSAIDHFDLRSFDLNLLVAFDAIMEERSVTRAAARLRIGQPAMSHSLATLRMLMADELFVRVGPKMLPTARASALAPQIRDALHQVQDSLRQPDRFDPLTQNRTFRLAFSSELGVLLMPDLAVRLRRSAPGIRLIGRTMESDEVHRLLDEGLLDLAIGCYRAAGPQHRAEPLFEQTLSCCFNPRLLELPLPLDAQTYVETEHVLVTLKDSLHGCLAEALDRLGAKLNVVAATSDFLSVLAAAADAPVLATLPTRMARRYAPVFGLSVTAVPLDLHVPAVSILWSARLDRDAGAVWLREQITAALAPYAP